MFPFATILLEEVQCIYSVAPTFTWSDPEFKGMLFLDLNCKMQKNKA